MDILLISKSIIMGIVEGITEFLPISSTGHLILTADLIKFLAKEKRDVYEIFIQLGAMLAVLWEYRTKIARTVKGAATPGQERRLLMSVIVAFIPAAIAGLLFNKVIKEHLFAPLPVAGAFFVGGLIILWAEKRQHTVRVLSVDELSVADAFKVGLLQCLALIPGTSRSGATIIGGLFLGLSRKAATEFSFFLGIPTLGAAALYSLYKVKDQLSMDDFGIFAIGLAAAFISAFFTIRALLRFISNHTFLIFGWYRVVFGCVILITAYTGIVDWAA